MVVPHQDRPGLPRTWVHLILTADYPEKAPLAEASRLYFLAILAAFTNVADTQCVNQFIWALLLLGVSRW